MMIALVVAAAAAAVPVPAKVTAVTVFNDRARITRTAHPPAGATRVELPLLPDSVDPTSVRLEAKGAQLRQVDLVHVDTDDFPADEARTLLDKLEKLDDHIELAARERAADGSELAALRRLLPVLPEPEPLKPLPRLNPTGWATSSGFIEGTCGRLQARMRELDQKLIDFAHQRQLLSERAQQVGGARRKSGLRVTALLGGEGAATLSLTYLVGGARWSPVYDLQYLPAQNQVQVSFAGAVTQTTGEDWNDAELTLSTSQPAQASALPKLSVWKIGQKERFEPRSRPLEPPRPLPGPPPAPQPEQREADQAARMEKDRLRGALLQEAGKSMPALEPRESSEPSEDEDSEEAEGAGVPHGVVGGMVSGAGARVQSGSGRGGAVGLGAVGGVARGMPMAAPKAPPPPQEKPYGDSAPAVELSVEVDAAGAAPRMESKRSANREAQGAGVSRGNAAAIAGAPPLQVGLLPPPSYRAPSFGADAPATLAGGYDLSFTSPRPASVLGDGSTRRVPLFAETWPVTTERIVVPALAQEAFLVAEIKNPSQRALPGGQAELSVGADPAGTARLKVVAPGEQFSLPLGLDRAIKPVRNIEQLQGEKGLFSKDEITQYKVTIEVANPYPQAMPLRIVDQVPLQGDKNLEVALLRSEPAAKVDKDKGELEWRLAVPAQGKSIVSFVYELKRPKGYRVHQ